MVNVSTAEPGLVHVLRDTFRLERSLKVDKLDSVP